MRRKIELSLPLGPLAQGALWHYLALPSLKGLLNNEFQQIVVERPGDVRTFTDPEDALRFCLGG